MQILSNEQITEIHKEWCSVYNPKHTLNFYIAQAQLEQDKAELTKCQNYISNREAEIHNVGFEMGVLSQTEAIRQQVLKEVGEWLYKYFKGQQYNLCRFDIPRKDWNNLKQGQMPGEK